MLALMVGFSADEGRGGMTTASPKETRLLERRGHAGLEGLFAGGPREEERPLAVERGRVGLLVVVGDEDFSLELSALAVQIAVTMSKTKKRTSVNTEYERS